MNKAKILIVATTILMLCLSGFLTYQLLFKPLRSGTDKDAGTVSAKTVQPDKSSPNPTPENSGNHTYNPSPTEYDDNNDNLGEGSNMPLDPAWTPATQMDLDVESITVYVNKEYPLPKDYVPKNMVVPNVLFDIEPYDARKLLRPEAASALEQMFHAAQRDGHTLYAISGYRSYDRQKQIFLNNIVKKGKKHTLLYSAVPGTSEHQTGLAMDISSKSLRYRLVTEFAASPEGLWVAKHAHEYGFIIRYGKDKESITGYAYEPWHIRYVGRDLATYLVENELTLDEYYNYTPGKDFDFEALYADLINYVPPAVPEIDPDDIDGDGIPNAIDDDIDGDGIPNWEDDDMDGDGIPNWEDDDMDGDGIPNWEDDDMDGDGIPNWEDDDMDGDGIPNSEDDDMDGDGIPNSEDDDIDGDGILNWEDDDMDGDGIPNVDDLDMNGNGIPNEIDDDMDSDGIPNHLDDDMDGDGIPNHLDDDMNGNGIHDFKEYFPYFPAPKEDPEEVPTPEPTKEPDFEEDPEASETDLPEDPQEVLPEGSEDDIINEDPFNE